MTIIDITKENYDSEIKNCSLPILIDFYGNNCSHCEEFKPKFLEFANNEKYNQKIKFCTLNAHNNKRFAVKYKVMSLPTVIMINKENEIFRLFPNKLDKLEDKLNEFLK